MHAMHVASALLIIVGVLILAVDGCQFTSPESELCRPQRNVEGLTVASTALALGHGSSSGFEGFVGCCRDGLHRLTPEAVHVIAGV